MTDDKPARSTRRSLASDSEQLGLPQFSIADLLVVTTIVGGLLGISALSPGWAVTLSCLAVVAMFRALIMLACYGTYKRIGRFWSIWLEFLVSVAIMSLIAIAGFAILIFGVFAAFEFGDRSGGGYVPKPVGWPFVTSLILAPAFALLVLWFTRRATRLLIVAIDTISWRSQ